MTPFIRRCFTWTINLLARTSLRSLSIFLTRRAKLDAMSAAIHWFIRQQGNRPLHISHCSELGYFTLMSDGSRIEVTWWLDDKHCDNETKPTDQQSNSTDPLNQTTPPEPARAGVSHVIGHMVSGWLRGHTDDKGEPFTDDRHRAGNSRYQPGKRVPTHTNKACVDG